MSVNIYSFIFSENSINRFLFMIIIIRKYRHYIKIIVTREWDMVSERINKYI